MGIIKIIIGTHLGPRRTELIKLIYWLKKHL